MSFLPWKYSWDSTGHRWPIHRSVEYHNYSSNCYMQSNGPTRDHYRDNNGHNQLGWTQYSPYQSNEGPEHIECTPNIAFVIAALNNHEHDEMIDRERNLTPRNRCARCFRHNTLNFSKYHDCYWQDCKCSGCTKLVKRQINRKLSINMGISSKPGPKPRAADTLGSGSTTCTTTGFVCQVCNRSFGYKNVLQNHERTHTGDKPFECRECHKRFTRDHHLKTHMRLHTGEKPYHCDHCERQFVRVADLRRHLRVHTGERPYHCQICPSKFSDSNQLKAHNLIHTGEKPFSCMKCQGKFRRRHHLKRHKCLNDAENIGKPRRGRRSTAYDELVAVSPAVPLRPNSTDETHIPVVTTAATVTSSAAGVAAAATSSPYYHHIPSVPQPTTSPIAKLMAITNGLSLESAPSKPRRKPRQTKRILTPQHRDFHREFHMEHNIQTQTLNLSLGCRPRDDSLNGKSESRSCQCLQFPCIKMLENSTNEICQNAFESNDKVLVNQQDNQSEFSLNKKIEDETVLDFILDYCP